MHERCAAHPELESVETCPRCGSFSCAGCWRPELSLCAACERAGHGRPPLEAEGLPKMLLLLTFRPSSAMDRVGDGPLAPPLATATFAWGIAAMTFGGLLLRNARLEGAWAFLGLATVGVAAAVTACTLIGLLFGLFHLALRIAGSATSARATLRAVLFLQLGALALVLRPLTTLVRVGAPDTFLILALVIDLCAVGWATLGATAFARAAGGLSERRALLASGSVGAFLGVLRLLAFVLAHELGPQMYEAMYGRR